MKTFNNKAYNITYADDIYKLYYTSEFICWYKKLNKRVIIQNEASALNMYNGFKLPIIFRKAKPVQIGYAQLLNEFTGFMDGKPNRKKK